MPSGNAAKGIREKGLRKRKTVLQDVYRVLSLCLGDPPASFTYRYKNRRGEVVTLQTTPMEFTGTWLRAIIHLLTTS